MDKTSEQSDRLPLGQRLAHNERIEAERRAWHDRKRNESDEWREAYEFMEVQEKQINDQMAEAFSAMQTVTRQVAQGVQPLRQEPDPVWSQPLQQQPDPHFNSPFAFGLLAMMFLDTEAIQKALRRMELCRQIFDADMEFRNRMYTVSGWEV